MLGTGILIWCIGAMLLDSQNQVPSIILMAIGLVFIGIGNRRCKRDF